MARSNRTKKDVRVRAIVKSKTKARAKRLRIIEEDCLLQFALTYGAV